MALVFCLNASACSITHNISIEKESAYYIQRHDAARIIGKDTGLTLLNEWASGGYIVVQFSANKDLEALSIKTDSVVIPDIGFCEKNSRVILGSLAVYSYGNVVGWRMSEYREEAGNEILADPQKFKYETIVFTEWKKERPLPDIDKTPAEEYYERYDFKVSPEDICIHIEGGNIVHSIKSNVIRLSKAEIMNLMKDQ